MGGGSGVPAVEAAGAPLRVRGAVAALHPPPLATLLQPVLQCALAENLYQAVSAACLLVVKKGNRCLNVAEILIWNVCLFVCVMC